jgi:hypothetical protein
MTDSRLFGDVSGKLPRLEPIRVIDSLAVTRVKYRVRT